MLRRLGPAFVLLLLLSSTAFARSPRSTASNARAYPFPPIRARAALVMDATSGTVLGALNAHLRLPMASTTKIMTALIALQHGSLSDRITVPKAAFNFEWDATVMGLHPGQVVTLKDLLYGLLLPSGADAANTIAIHYGGSEAGFVAMMNKEAQQLGMHDTHYSNAHGLTARNHYTSAYDLALLAQYVSYIPQLMAITSTRSHTWNGHVLTNLNRPLFWYPGVDGIKPGYTDDAGICQVLDARRDGRHIIVTLLHTPDLVIDARNLLDFGLRDFTWIQTTLPGDAPTLTQRGLDNTGSYDYFPASGHYVHGRFLSAFQAAGGLSALGFPRTEPLYSGKSATQYFENGELVLNTSNGRVTRVPIGALGSGPPAPPTPIPATPTATPSPPREGSLPLHGTPTPRAIPTPTRSRPAGPGPTSPKPTPRPPSATSNRSGTGAIPPVGPVQTAGMFASFQHTHFALVGAPTGQLRHFHGYPVQFFAYGALVYDQHTRRVYMLPLGDRLLNSKHYLPDYAGNAYPPGYAPVALLKAIGWGQYSASR